MTEVQGWLAIALGFASLLSIVWRMSDGFSKLRAEIHLLATTVSAGFKRADERFGEIDRDRTKIDTRIQVQDRVIHRHGEDIAVLKAEAGD